MSRRSLTPETPLFCAHIGLRTWGVQLISLAATADADDDMALQVLLEQVAAPGQEWQWGTGKPHGSSDGSQEDTPPALLVGNTHLLFNPKRGDIKVCDSPESPTQLTRLNVLPLHCNLAVTS